MVVVGFSGLSDATAQASLQDKKGRLAFVRRRRRRGRRNGLGQGQFQFLCEIRGLLGGPVVFQLSHFVAREWTVQGSKPGIVHVLVEKSPNVIEAVGFAVLVVVLIGFALVGFLPQKLTEHRFFDVGTGRMGFIGFLVVVALTVSSISVASPSSVAGVSLPSRERGSRPMLALARGRAPIVRTADNHAIPVPVSVSVAIGIVSGRGERIVEVRGHPATANATATIVELASGWRRGSPPPNPSGRDLASKLVHRHGRFFLFLRFGWN
mmetsp:Transcript_17161/g.47210  ORF Transcript_17161/g.47210 Transcript_17161/m.47210 type:complete len:266 (+) Transcript_17161:4892-5689(+)